MHWKTEKYGRFSSMTSERVRKKSSQSQVVLGTHVFIDKSLPGLQLPIHLSRITVNG